MAQSSQFHAGMCRFWSLMPQVCDYIKSGHTFGSHVVIYGAKSFDRKQNFIKYLLNKKCRFIVHEHAKIEGMFSQGFIVKSLICCMTHDCGRVGWHE
jgi:hypothetical protein